MKIWRKERPIMSTVSDDRIKLLNLYWDAVNYLGVAQLYLWNNPLLKEPLKSSDIKPRLLGHWGTQPGLNLVYAHLNRLIQDTAASVLLVVGPGHGAPAILSNLYLEGTLTEYYPELDFTMEGLLRFVRKFSTPDGMPSHLFPGTPGMLHEGGELGYGLSHAFGTVFDNPDLLTVCIVGDGEAETGPLAAAWHSTKYLNPATSGAVLPILHLNGYKLSGPSLFGRMTDQELKDLFSGYGYNVRMVEGDDPDRVHRDMWETLDEVYREISSIQKAARQGNIPDRIIWPMIVLKTPKGWTCPKEIDGKAIENTFHSHQIPVADPEHNEEHLKILENWMRSYKPEVLFNPDGKPVKDVLSLCPEDDLRIGKNPHTNGGEFLKPLKLPDFKDYAVEVDKPTAVKTEGTRNLARYVRDVFKQNKKEANFRFFCPDETTSNRMEHIFEETERVFMWPLVKTDEFLSRDGRVMEILSEHTCEGWLEGYLLTGRHGLFACYEAFIPIIDSMLNQYAKWLKVAHEIPWRKPLSSMNYLLTSHVWRQDHNGYSHQVPSFINNVANKKSSVARVYLPPDANCLLSVVDHCLASKDYVNLIVASKQNIPQYLDMKAAVEHCARGASIWDWASNDQGNPDIILASAGDVPTEETVAAAGLLRQELPDLRVRVVNIVDLFTLISHHDHTHGLDEDAFLKLFGRENHVIFAFHGYPRLIHELIHHRPNPQRFHVHGYIEEGRTTTPFNMRVLNKISRYHLAIAALNRVERIRSYAGTVIDKFNSKLQEHESYIVKHDDDMPEIKNWRWNQK
jgi:xylulose-5-phosphate/fructose-6-phosphate phosphoketolase